MRKNFSILFLVCLCWVLLLSSTALGGGKEVPERKNIPSQYKWKLEDIYANDKLWEKDFNQAKELLPQLARYKGNLQNSPKNLLSCLETNERISQLVSKLYAYAFLKSCEDARNTTYQALNDKALTLAVQFDSAASYLTPEILAIPEQTLSSYIAQEKGLQVYRFYLEEILRQKKHVLSTQEEELVARMGELGQAPENIYSMLTNADMKFPQIKDEQGKAVELSEERYIKYLQSPSRQVRKEAFQGLYHTYQGMSNTLGSVFSSSIKTDTFYAQVRKYDSALQAALEPDNIPMEVYDNVIKTVNKNLKPLHRYMALRKKILGVKELHMYDLYVPLAPKIQKDIPYEEAKSLVLAGLKPLGKEYQDVLQEGFQKGWIDVYENQGKRRGGFSYSVYGINPYILLNYQDNLNDTFTLAHEMGHSLHSYYAQKNQPYVYADYTLFLAEVASTTNEALLMDYLLKKTTDKQEKLYLLNYYLEQIRTTVYRQTMFAEFEKIVHGKAEAGEALTPDLLSAIWHDLNVKYYGPEMLVDPEIDMEWARIPHFYNAFYVYKYVTGYAAATSLSRQILQEGEPARKRYLNFLSQGSSQHSLDILKGAGVDMTTPQPLEDTLKVFEEKLAEMERTLAEK